MERLTVEDKIMGRTEPLPKTDLELKAFTPATKYEVYAEGNDNKKVVDGTFIDKILSMETKTLIKNGEMEVKANGLVIKRLKKKEKLQQLKKLLNQEEGELNNG